jgi:hypothetical protein
MQRKTASRSARDAGGSLAFEAAREPDPRLREVMRRMSWKPMEGSGFPARYPTRLRATTRNGRVHQAEVPDVDGSPMRPFTPQRVQD